MTSCVRVRDLLVGYHLVALGADERRCVEEHLAGCLGCVRELIALKRAFETGSDPRPPPEAKARIRAAVLGEVAGRRPRAMRGERTFALTAAVALLVVAARVTTLLTGGEGAPPRGAWSAGSVAEREERVVLRRSGMVHGDREAPRGRSDRQSRQAHEMIQNQALAQRSP
jgi:anti-sigma factor RsiW